MSFESPVRLWLLVGVAAIAVLYLVLQRRRSRYAVRFTNLDLLASVAPKRPGWRRHVPAAAMALALAGLPALTGGLHDLLDGYAAAMTMLAEVAARLPALRALGRAVLVEGRSGRRIASVRVGPLARRRK